MMERRLQSAWIEPREGVKVAKERKEDLSRKKAKKGRKNGNPLHLIFFANFLRLLAAKDSPSSFQLSAFQFQLYPSQFSPLIWIFNRRSTGFTQIKKEMMRGFFDRR
jgi:hypothetical protein